MRLQTNRVAALTALGRLDDALESARRAVELAPHDGPALGNLGNVLGRLGRAGEAAEAEDAAPSKPDPMDATINRVLRSINVPSRAEVNAIAARIEALGERVAELQRARQG